MEALKDYSLIDIHHMSLNVQKEHEQIKAEINELLDMVDRLKEEITNKENQLQEKEEEYLILMEALVLKKKEEQEDK